MYLTNYECDSNYPPGVTENDINHWYATSDEEELNYDDEDEVTSDTYDTYDTSDDE